MAPAKQIAAAIGTFDGVHIGHEAVLQTLMKEAAGRNLGTPTVFTFDRHPLQVIAPERAPKRIMAPEREAEILRSGGFIVELLRFDAEMMHTTARQWLRKLRDEKGLAMLVMGYDNTFGCDGRNLRPEDYHRIGNELGIEVCSAPVVPGVSSSAIRKAIAAGEIAHALEMLGRPFVVEGRVEHGRAIGRTIGFPTANVATDPQRLMPANGVYAASATVDGETYNAVVNVGVRPTVNDGEKLSVEAHLIDFHGDIYGREIALDFRRRLRSEKKFASLDELKRQIARDVASVF